MNLKSNSFAAKSAYLLAAFVITATVFGLSFKVGQSDFQEIALFYFPCFIAYALVYHFVHEKSLIRYFTGFGILLRILLIFSFPNLSDDVYRFIWDGTLAVNGVNPFNHLPGYFIENQKDIPGISQELFDKLNSPNYFSIYPPVCQGIFAVSCFLFPLSWMGSAAVMKIFMVTFECGSIFLIVKLLRHFEMPAKNVLLYALNPLVIIEISGNLHFEGAMIFFLLLAIWLLVKNRFHFSAIAIAFSIASKLLPLIFLPFLIRRLGWRKSIQYFGLTLLVLLILFSPLINGIFIQNFSKSLELYFQKFEFNASIYYLLRWLFHFNYGYNQIAVIGPWLGFAVLTGVIIFAFKEKDPNSKNLFNALLFAICLYLFLATTVHPWYTILPVTLCIFTKFRFPVVWSGLAILTYINYSYPEYYENLWVVGLEYLVVFSVLLLELKTSKIADPV